MRQYQPLNMETQFIFDSSVNEQNVIVTISAISNSISAGATKLNLFVSSPGGDMDAGFRLYDFLRSLPIEVITIGFGQVNSIAVIIFLAGEHRKCTRGCTFFIHEGSFTNAYQNTAFKIIEESNMLLTSQRKKNIDTISERTGKDGEQITNIANNGKILTASQAKNLNIVEEVIEKLPLQKLTQLPATQPTPQIPQPIITPTPSPSPTTTTGTH